MIGKNPGGVQAWAERENSFLWVKQLAGAGNIQDLS